jgi:purine-binding chemotaxis protein CheW
VTSSPAPDLTEVVEQLGRDPDAPPAQAPAPEQTSYLVFRAGRFRYALPAAAVQQVTAAQAWVAVPGTPAFVRGVVQLGGRILTALDLESLLHGGPPGAEPPRLMLAVRAEATTYVLPVAEVTGLLEVELTRCTPPTETTDAAACTGSFLEGEQVVTVLEPGRLLAHAESRVGGAG